LLQETWRDPKRDEAVRQLDGIEESLSALKFKCEKFNFLKKRMCDDFDGHESE
jgi:hypothetical protein